ncbi:protein O-mannosyl-transferase TMTC4-like isoform X4 [Homalodisca vitripennis]|uniref:protein O-mannosyl-transferase TMTC4-like isoform X4 n=1 Tax=Homalodisca vitripennis TaxID=197043 RepID=UPI001EEC4456|nr:protein O-mannosyl-transferase TMTC4-like isoform X4 [Homalodisca vitripennis]
MTDKEKRVNKVPGMIPVYCLLFTDMSTGLSLSIITLLAVTCFYKCVGGGFVFDDMEAVVNNDDIKLSTSISTILDNDFWGTRITHNASHKSYRPLTILSYRLNLMAAGGELKASQFHLVNLVLYILVCCLSLFVTRALSGGESSHSVSFITAVLFTVHPVHTEAVVPVVGRADLLCALFMFCAFLVYCQALESKTRILVHVFLLSLTVLLATASMFAKEQGITILAICSAYDFLISEKKHPRHLLKFSMTWSKFQDTGLIVRQIILLSTTCALFLLRWWIMGGTVPVFQKVDNPASFLDSMLLRIVSSCLALLVLVFCVRSYLRTVQWANERDLFQSAIAVCPLNAKVHYNLAKTSPNITEALEHYKDALRLNPDYDQAMNNLANILKDLGELSEAQRLLKRALQLRPDFAAAWMNLGIVLSNQKQFIEAEQCYWKAINYRRKYPDCFYNLGNLYLEQKKHSKAYESWRQATKLNPRHHAAWNNLIIMLDSIGRHSEASSVGQEALTHLPNSSAIHFNIANSLGKTSNFAEAERYFKAAIELNPKYPLYYVNLGVLYHHWKKFGLAKEMYLQALKLEPNMKSARDNLQLLI